MIFFKNQVPIYFLCAVLLPQVSFSGVIAAPVTQVIMSPTQLTVTPMKIPGMSDNFDITTAGPYAYAFVFGDALSSFYNGHTWSHAQKVPGDFFTFGYPMTGARSDAWMINKNQVEHFSQGKLLDTTPLATILNTSSHFYDLSLEAVSGYVFLIGYVMNQREQISTIHFSVWSPKTGRWSKAITLEDMLTDIVENREPAVAYNPINPTAVLLAYSGYHTSKLKKHILTIASDGTFSLYDSSALPEISFHGTVENLFLANKTGVYAVFAASSGKWYLWYNHSANPLGWHKVELLAEPFGGSSELVMQSLNKGTFCMDTDMGVGGVGISCIDTMATKLQWSGPIKIGSYDEDEDFVTSKDGAWLPSVSVSGLSQVSRYDMNSESLYDTHFKSPPYNALVSILPLPHQGALACLPYQEDPDQLFIYDDSDPSNAQWKELPDAQVNVHGCRVNFDATRGDSNIFWYSDTDNQLGHRGHIIQAPGAWRRALN